jgi:sugar phosphate isomerase/epimerase
MNNFTRTGRFPIGFRVGWSDWQKDLAKVIAWAKGTGFNALDVGRNGDVAGKMVKDAGLKVGSVDLKEWNGMLSPDPGKRTAAVDTNAEYVKAVAAAIGPANHFVVMLPEDPAKPRKDNFAWMVESFSALAPTLEHNNARIVIEGWPGPGALCCTPETYRAFFKAVPSKSMGINFDPSHLIRMGIDPHRFLLEFADRVGHVHGKDAILLSDLMYDCGWEQPATFHRSFGFGATVWRYTIPGHGQFNWVQGFGVLKERGYTGCVCVELEDENFNGTETGEQTGLRLGRDYLEGC